VSTCLKFISRSPLQFRQKLLPVIFLLELHEDWDGSLFLFATVGPRYAKIPKSSKSYLKKIDVAYLGRFWNFRQMKAVVHLLPGHLDILRGGKRKFLLDHLHEISKHQSFFALFIAFFPHFFHLNLNKIN
jgi:hypothetical protein